VQKLIGAESFQGTVPPIMDRDVAHLADAFFRAWMRITEPKFVAGCGTFCCRTRIGLVCNALPMHYPPAPFCRVFKCVPASIDLCFFDRIVDVY
jgi:hypothetical protein